MKSEKAMTNISISISTRDALTPGLEKRLSKMGDLTEFHKLAGEHLLNSVQENFDNETAPDGSRWQALTPVTIEKRLKQNGNAPLKILRASGRLAGSIHYQASSSRTGVGTNLVCAAIHNEGGKAGPMCESG